MIKVVKFGGSSVADATQFAKVKNIVESESSRKFVIVSACGKTDKEDHKVTDLLYLCHAHVKYGVSYEPLLQMIEQKYNNIKNELHLSLDLDSEFNQIRALMKKDTDVDYIVSRGEYLTARLMAEYLHAQFVDAKDLIFFNYDGSINYEKITSAFNNMSLGTDKVVVPGFYGSMPNGHIRVMSRGGSDITGSIIANITDASVYENWTDVSGMLVSDPRLVKDPRSIKRITYNELREMSYMGANVLHEEAIFPVRQKRIPINIRNTNNPDHPGTMIMENCDSYDAVDMPPVLTGITGKKNFSVISVAKSHISSEVGVLQKALQIVSGYNLSVESVSTGIDSFSIVLDTETSRNCIYELMSDLKESMHVDSITMQDQIAMVAFVGRRLKNLKGFSGRLFGELGNNGINIRLISQTADEISIIVGVSNDDYEKTINCIYDRFIRNGEEE